MPWDYREAIQPSGVQNTTADPSSPRHRTDRDYAFLPEGHI
jgi:hypothetical protein